MSIKQLRDDNNGKLPAYAWPGSPIVYYSKAGNTYCSSCANQTKADPPIVAYDIRWEGRPVICDGCSAEIESAYGDSEEEN